MAKEKKQDSGWQFPKALEIVKCKEGNKEFMKERPARRPFGNTVLICEYPLDGGRGGTPPRLPLRTRLDAMRGRLAPSNYFKERRYRRIEIQSMRPLRRTP